jgi:hypothetical protein
MKKENDEILEAYKIRIDALEIMNQAYLAKIEALEMLNKNLQFLREVKALGTNGTSYSAPSQTGIKQVQAQKTGEKRGRGRPRKYPVSGSGSVQTVSPVLVTGEKRGRGRPRKYSAGAAPATTSAVKSGEKRGRGRPRKYPEGTAPYAVKSSGISGEKRGRGRPRKTDIASKPSGVTPVEQDKKRGRPRGSSITRLQLPLETWLRDHLADDGFNKATFRALTGILLCLFENGTATVSTLNEYIGGSRVTIVRHTGFLKKMELLTYVGSRKKGYYALTPKGQALYERLVNA